MVSSNSTVNLLLCVIGLGCVLSFMSIHTTGRINIISAESSFGFAPVITEMKLAGLLRGDDNEGQQMGNVDRKMPVVDDNETERGEGVVTSEETTRPLRLEGLDTTKTVEPGMGQATKDATKNAVATVSVVEKQSTPKNSTVTTPPAVQSNRTTTTWPPPMDHVADSQRRIILLIVNCGYIDMADNLIQSLLSLKLTNFVIVPLDRPTYTTLRQIYPERVVPIMPGLEEITDTATYGSDAFKALTSSRANIVHKFLEQGYTIFYCDLDMVWRKNALEYISNQTDTNGYELVVVNDHNRHTVCSCFLYMKPTPNNLELLEMWDAEIRTGEHEQDQPAFQAALKAKALHIRGRELKYLKIAADTTFIPSGKMYFKLWNSTIKDEVMIVHNNYIRGHEAKRERFANFSLWNPTGNLDKVSYSCKTVTTRRLESCSSWLDQVERREKRRLRQ